MGITQEPMNTAQRYNGSGVPVRYDVAILNCSIGSS
jgi:hypothetical protein